MNLNIMKSIEKMSLINHLNISYEFINNLYLKLIFKQNGTENCIIINCPQSISTKIMKEFIDLLKNNKAKYMEICFYDFGIDCRTINNLDYQCAIEITQNNKIEIGLFDQYKNHGSFLTLDKKLYGKKLANVFENIISDKEYIEGKKEFREYIENCRGDTKNRFILWLNVNNPEWREF